MSKKDKAPKGRGRGGSAKDAKAALQADLDSIIEEQGGEPVPGRKHTFDMTKNVDKLKNQGKK